MRIMGTAGELIANSSDNFVTVYEFATRQSRQIKLSDLAVDDTIDGGHGGADQGMIYTLDKRLNGNCDSVSFCSIDETYRNHLIAFAAEESRLTGQVVDLREYEARFGDLR